MSSSYTKILYDTSMNGIINNRFVVGICNPILSNSPPLFQDSATQIVAPNSIGRLVGTKLVRPVW
jgi:hypothetical protein